MVPMLRTMIAVSVVGAVGLSIVGHSPSARDVVAAPSLSELVAATGDTARRLGNERVVAEPPTPQASPVVTTAIALANAERAAAGLGPLTAHPQLLTAAFAHSHDMAAMRRMSHTGSDGSSAGDRLDRAGYRWQTWAENVAAGYPTAASVTDGWMNSPGHRANVLNASMVHIGIGVVNASDGTAYWTMILAA